MTNATQSKFESLVNAKVSKLKEEGEKKKRLEQEKRDKEHRIWLSKCQALKDCLLAAGLHEDNIRDSDYNIAANPKPYCEFQVLSVLGQMKMFEGSKERGFHLYVAGYHVLTFSLDDFNLKDFTKVLCDAIAVEHLKNEEDLDTSYLIDVYQAQMK